MAKRSNRPWNRLRSSTTNRNSVQARTQLHPDNSRPDEVLLAKALSLLVNLSPHAPNAPSYSVNINQQTLDDRNAHLAREATALFTNNLGINPFAHRSPADRQDRILQATVSLGEHVLRLPNITPSIVAIAIFGSYELLRPNYARTIERGSPSTPDEDAAMNQYSLTLCQYLFTVWKGNPGAKPLEMPEMKWGRGIEDWECDEDEMEFLRAARAWFESCWGERAIEEGAQDVRSRM